MYAARSRGRDAATEPSGVLGVRASHERSGLLVADLYEANFVLMLSESLYEAVDPVTGNSKDDIDAPLVNGLNQYLRSSLYNRHYAALRFDTIPIPNPTAAIPKIVMTGCLFARPAA